jgi:hypothetical protein
VGDTTSGGRGMIFGTESALQFFTKVARHATLAFGALRAPLGTIIHHSGGNDVKFGDFHYLGIFSGISGSHVAWARAKAMWPFGVVWRCEKCPRAVRRCHTRRRPTPSHGTFPDRSWDALGRIHTRGSPTIVEICILGAIVCPESRFWPILGHNPGLDPPVRPPPVPTKPHGHPTGRGHARA